MIGQQRVCLSSSKIFFCNIINLLKSWSTNPKVTVQPFGSWTCLLLCFISKEVVHATFVFSTSLSHLWRLSQEEHRKMCLAIGGSLEQCLVPFFSLQGLFCYFRELQQTSLDNTVWFVPIALGNQEPSVQALILQSIGTLKQVGVCGLSHWSHLFPSQNCWPYPALQSIIWAVTLFLSSLWSLSLHIWVISLWPWQLYYLEQSPVSASGRGQTVADV